MDFPKNRALSVETIVSPDLFEMVGRHPAKQENGASVRVVANLANGSEVKLKTFYNSSKSIVYCNQFFSFSII